MGQRGLSSTRARPLTLLYSEPAICCVPFAGSQQAGYGGLAAAGGGGSRFNGRSQASKHAGQQHNEGRDTISSRLPRR